jgi:hypothetical protein
MNTAAQGRQQAARRRRERVQNIIDNTQRAGGSLTVSAIARAASVDRSYLYRHPDLLQRLHQHQAVPTVSVDPGPSHASLRTELANAQARAKRLHDRVQLLERRLSELLGEQAWRESGLGAPLDVEALQHANTDLQERNLALVAQLDERDRDLAAARAANRELMIRMNSAS